MSNLTDALADVEIAVHSLHQAVRGAVHTDENDMEAIGDAAERVRVALEAFDVAFAHWSFGA